MKKIIGSKRVTNVPLPNLIVVLLISVPTQLLPFPKAKPKPSFQNYIHYDGPQYHQSYGLENAFASLKTNNSSGYDDIPAHVVKRVSDEIFVILKHIFNIFLTKGVFPDKLKIARVTTTFKKGKDILVTNCRAISILPCFSKLLQPLITRFFIKSNSGFKMHFQQNMLFSNQ